MGRKQPKVKGSWYWECYKGEGESQGIVVMCAWMLSKPRYLAPYVRLYGSCGWDTLVCQPQMLNLFFPKRSGSFACDVLIELSKEIEKRPRPVVFATFSGGHRGCLHKILQILQGRYDGTNSEMVNCDEVRRCVVSQIYDSSPVDFVTEMGAIFVTHQVLTSKPGRPIAVVNWLGNTIAKVLDFLFHSQLEPERVELWRTFYSSMVMGPILFLCSENDELSPIETIFKCRSHLLDLGGTAKVISWEKSEHVGHLRHHPEGYKIAVRDQLSEAAGLYSKRSAGCSSLPQNIEAEISRISRLPHIRGLKRKSRNT